MVAALAVLFAVTVTRDAALRSSCDGSEGAAGTVPAGTAVEIRFAVSDGSNCYKIAATVDGKPVLGYIDGAALAGTQAFDQQRRGGAPLDSASQSPHLAMPIEQPRDTGQSGEKLYGMRVALRYDREALPVDVAREMVAVLDDDLIRISGQLGCATGERITVIVEDRGSYLKTTKAAEWSAGLYDGRIHISLTEGQNFGPGTRRIFAHETVHACLANIGRFPTWIHEGLAQKLSGDTLSAQALAELRRSIASGAVPKLENLGQNWSGLSEKSARLAYNLSLAAADALVENYSNYGIPNLLRNPGMLRQVTSGVDKALGL